MSKELNVELNVIDKARIKFWQVLHSVVGRTYDETQEKIITGYGKLPGIDLKLGESKNIGDGAILRKDDQGNLFTEEPKDGLNVGL